MWLGAPRVISNCFADFDDFDELGGIRIEIDHVGRLPLAALRARIHGHADIGLSEGRGIVGAIARPWATSLPLACSRLISAILLRGRASGQENRPRPAWRAISSGPSGDYSPVIIMVRMPIARAGGSKRSRIPPLTISVRGRWTPRTRPFWRDKATGVPPPLENCPSRSAEFPWGPGLPAVGYIFRNGVGGPPLRNLAGHQVHAQTCGSARRTE